MGRGTHRGIPQICRTIPSRGISRRVRLRSRLLGALVLIALVAAPAGARAADDVPPGGFFVDDDGSTHEPAINALAAAGFTDGCGEGRFCPEKVVTRGQMATFLARVLDLDDARPAPFDDVTGSAHRKGIDRVFASGITKGCTETSFCPELGINPGAGGLVPQPGLCLSDRRGASLFRCRRSSCRGCSRAVGVPVSPRVVTTNGPGSATTLGGSAPSPQVGMRPR